MRELRILDMLSTDQLRRIDAEYADFCDGDNCPLAQALRHTVRSGFNVSRFILGDDAMNTPEDCRISDLANDFIAWWDLGYVDDRDCYMPPSLRRDVLTREVAELLFYREFAEDE